MPSTIPCKSLSPLISRFPSSLFSDWRRTVSSKFFDPLVSMEKLVLPRYACCVLSCLRCNGHSLLLSSYLSRIGQIENPSCSACAHSSQNTSNLILHCPPTDCLRRWLFGDSLSLYDLCSRPGKLPGFWGSMVFRHAPILERGRVATTTTTTWQNDIRKYMRKKRILFKFEDSGIAIASVISNQI